MLQAPKPPTNPVEPPAPESPGPLSSQAQPSTKSTREFVAHIEDEFDSGTWDRAAHSAAGRRLVDGQLSTITGREGGLEQQPTPRPQTTFALDDQALKEDLLANDSLGG